MSEVEFQTADCTVLKFAMILAATPGPCQCVKLDRNAAH